jgi:hypothetical protein
MPGKWPLSVLWQSFERRGQSQSGELARFALHFRLKG